jgi:hypothetical protein
MSILNSQLIKEIKEQYPSLKMWSDTHAYELYKKIQEHQLITEAKYNTEITLTSKYAYHITPDLKWSKIKALGLTPKTQGKLGDHPGRIYLLTNIDNLEDYGGDINDIAFALYNVYKNKDKVKEMYLLKIDLTNLKNHKFFEDPNFHMGEAVWTYQNIPPSVISIINKIDITF